MTQYTRRAVTVRAAGGDGPPVVIPRLAAVETLGAPNGAGLVPVRYEGRRLSVFAVDLVDDVGGLPPNPPPDEIPF